METTTTIEEQILERLRKLPEEKQREVVDIIEALARVDVLFRDVIAPVGQNADDARAAAHRGVAEARREMWGNFPREVPR